MNESGELPPTPMIAVETVRALVDEMLDQMSAQNQTVYESDAPEAVQQVVQVRFEGATLALSTLLRLLELRADSTLGDET